MNQNKWNIVVIEVNALQKIGVNNMEELKKCPFCGGEATLKIHYGFDEKVISAFVYCEECGVATRRCALETTAIGKWNRRVEE